MRWFLIGLHLLWAAPQPINQIIAVVMGEILTEERFRMEARLALAWHQGLKVADAPLSPELRVQLKKYVLNSWIIVAQFPSGVLLQGDRAIDWRLQALIHRLGGKEAWSHFCQHWGFTPDLVREMIQHQLLAEQFIQQRLRLERKIISHERKVKEPEFSLDEVAPLLQKWLVDWRQQTKIEILDQELLQAQP